MLMTLEVWLLCLHHSSSAIWNNHFHGLQILFFVTIDTGKGVLYTSDSDGIVFGESLQHHLVCLPEFLLLILYSETLLITILFCIILVFQENWVNLVFLCKM